MNLMNEFQRNAKIAEMEKEIEKMKNALTVEHVLNQLEMGIDLMKDNLEGDVDGDFEDTAERILDYVRAIRYIKGQISGSVNILATVREAEQAARECLEAGG
jgi:RecA/RadA recombinase